MKKFTKYLSISLTAAILSACGGTSVNPSNNEGNTPHPEFNSKNITQTPSYSPSGDITKNKPSFSWLAVAGATKYQFGHEGTEDGSNWRDYTVTSTEAGCPNTGDTCEYTPSDYTIPFNEKKVWWIHAFTSGSWKGWSRPIVFTVKDGGPISTPNAPTPLMPTGLINTVAPEFTWKPINGATNYTLGFESPNLANSWKMQNITAVEANCQTGSKCAYTITDPNFVAGKGFTWWLKSKVNGQWSPWSSAADFSFGQTQTEKPFKFKVKGYVTYTSGNASHPRPIPHIHDKFVIKTDPVYSYNYNVDCNDDGVLEGENITGSFTCPAPTSEEKTISISGFFPHFYGNRTEYLTEVTQWGTQKWLSMKDSFSEARDNFLTATDIPDLSRVSSMRNMFKYVSVNNNTISMWDVSHVSDMRGLFDGAGTNVDISSWNVSNVTRMDSMFAYNETFNQDIGNWDVSKVTDMSTMFVGAHAFNQNLNNWNVSNVTDMRQMFHHALDFNQPLSNWDTGNVTDMGAMFGGTKFNQDISNWNVSNVKEFVSMFQGSAFNQSISNWDVSQATRMSFMFDNTPFNQDISTWDVSNVTDMQVMFSHNNAFSTNNYSRLLTTWSSLGLQRNVRFDAPLTKYSASAASARKRLIDNFGWTIKDAGQL